LFHKPLSQVTVEDINSLITNKVSEGTTIDYKSQYTVSSDKEKKEFLADICSFANTNGGYIFFGISEGRDFETNAPTGNPEEAIGLLNFNGDAETLKLEQMIRDCISPRLSSVQMRRIDGFPTGSIFIVQIAQSWSAPHMVTYLTKHGFYLRGNAGKFIMDTDQIRGAFLNADHWKERTKEFHLERVKKISDGDTPVPTKKNRCLILHMIPLSFLRSSNLLDISILSKRSDLAPILSDGFSSRINLEGYLTFFPPNSGAAISYAHIYRNGTVELAVFSDLWVNDGQVRTLAIESYLIKTVQRFSNFYQDMSLYGPVAIFLSAVGYKGLEIRVDSHRMPSIQPKIFDRSVVTLPESLIDSAGVPADMTLKPIFDAFYNAAGWEKCVHYSSDGR